MPDSPKPPISARQLSVSEVGAIAHLYRAEVYRSTAWRTRLDTTTNWAVISLGVSLSITFSSRSASPIPLILVGFLIMFFLALESRRYRYFNVWRARARWMETHFYSPMLVDGDLHLEEHWQEVLANDYMHPRYHLTYIQALGRRVRQSYLWILLIQSIAYLGKIAIHPTSIESLSEVWARAEVGPVSGQVIIGLGVAYVATGILLALYSWQRDRFKHGTGPDHSAMG